ncbi:MAG: 2-succinyl-5-enolpyruvyl-6-hydroxy-3-cyclohexene-1-carboxylic-acid synthase [Bdellovibrionales bacterium]|nr:2-succinyl-5-enolpyruvyl-6-hydroxy-3-cyclohexene-1-carboxylic-acid synthase [Bdellovibrionales bacterium]
MSRATVSALPTEPHTDTLLTLSRGINELSARVIIEEFWRLGIQQFCVSPGARAIPFIQALEGDHRFETKLFNDERDAAFWAQGYGKATGKPAVLLSTSGTAVANYLPATIEAQTSRAPMILLTCDRPAELQYAHANQTINQLGLLRDYVACQINLPAPESNLYPHSLLSNIDQVVFAAVHHQSPVQINIALRKPFFNEAPLALPDEEQRLLSEWLENKKVYTKFCGPSRLPHNTDLTELVETINNAHSILLIAGPLHAHEDAQQIVELAAHLNSPLVADIDSNCRFSQSSHVISAYNLFLRSSQTELPSPNLVLYFGDRIISEALREYLESLNCPQIQIAQLDGRQDAIENEFLRFTERFVADPCALAAHLSSSTASKNSADFLHPWQTQQSLATEHLSSQVSQQNQAQGICEPLFFHMLAKYIPDDTALFHSPSLVVREAEQCTFFPGKKISSGANRGTQGIDGIISSALGFSQGREQACTLICGDQAFLHDSGALSLVASHPYPLFIIVINNNGGAIFRFFSMGDAQPTMENAHHMQDFSALAHHYGLPYFSARKWNEAEGVLKQAYLAETSALIEIHTDGIESVETFKRLGRWLS